MYIKRLLVVVAILICSSQISFSQSNDPCGCNIALAQGPYAEVIKTGSQEAKTNLAYFVATASYETYQKASQGGGGLEVFGLFGFGGGMSESEFVAKQKALRLEYKLDSTLNIQQTLIERYGDKEIIGGWVTCKKDCNTDGLHSWLEQNDDTHFTLRLRWKPFPGTKKNPVIDDSSIEGGYVKGMFSTKVFPPKKTLVPGITSASVIRVGKKAIKIHLDIPGLDVDEFAPIIPDKIEPPKPTGLVNWWSGDGNAKDSIGQADAIRKNVNFGKGKIGQAFVFNGTDSCLSVPGPFGGGGEATVMAWVNVSSSTGDFQALVSSIASGEFIHLQLWENPANLPNAGIAIYSPAKGFLLPIIQPTPYGVWRHIALSIKSGDTRLYVDGELAGQSSEIFSNIAPTTNLRIGCGHLERRFFKGQIDEVKIFNRALTREQIEGMYGEASFFSNK